MNKIHIIGSLIMLFVAVFSVSLVLAEENSTDVAEPSLISAPTNDSVSEDEAVSGWKYGWEKFKLSFVRNETVKAERELQLARWKIAEAKVAMKNGNFEKAEKAMEAQDAILERVKERVSKMENKSLTPGLDQALKVHENRMNELGNAFQNANLTEAQRERVQERISKIEEGNQQLAEIRLKIEERRQEELKAYENKTERLEERGDKVQERIRERVEQNSSDDSEDETETEDSENSSNSSVKSN